jgi:spoIIIJ-associated protein
MLKEVIAVGKDVAEAKENARTALGAGPLDDVNFEILHLGSKGIFGIIGVKPAQVKATIEVPDTQEKKKFDRPRRENKPGEKNEAKGGEHKKNNKKNKKSSGAKNAGRQENKAPKTESTVPVETLKMELREVGEGEDMSYEFVKTLISDIGLDAHALLYSCEDGTRRITIEGSDASVLIGHHGDTLDAIQYLANLASARKNVNGERDKSRVTLDIEGYRAKREETLRALARRMAAKALRNKRSVMLEPMTAYERRIIHSEIQGIEGVSTNSIGSDNHRKIVVYLTDKKPKEIFDEEEQFTSLKEEFTQDADEAESIGAVEVSTPSDLEAQNETVTMEQTHPAEDYSDEDEDIK